MMEDMHSQVQVAGTGVPKQISVARCLPYCAACFCTATCSGGLILGVGPFSARLLSEGFVLPEQISIVFTGAFQIMTWGSIFAVHVESRLGPRLSASIGACIQLTGHILMANLPNPVNPYVVMAAYGLLGWGGNHIFFSCFQFAQLFSEHIGVADGFLAGLFNGAGCVFLVLNAPFITVHLLFKGMACVAGSVLVVVLILWPDKNYRSGDLAFVSRPTLRHTKSILSMAMYRKGWRHITNFRYAMYATTFAISTLISMYVGGNLIVYQNMNTVEGYYMKWAYPLIANPTFLFTWIVGLALDKVGFAPVVLMLLCCAQVSLWCLANTHSALAAWMNLVLINWTCSIQYTIQFVFLHKAIPEDAFSVGLVTVLIIQGLFGFVGTPGLTPNPWGENYIPPVATLSLLALPLVAWPVTEWRLYRRKKRNPSLLIPSSPIASGVGFHSSVFIGLDSDESILPASSNHN